MPTTTNIVTIYADVALCSMGDYLYPLILQANKIVRQRFVAYDPAIQILLSSSDLIKRANVKKKYRFDIKLMMADCEANYARICRLLPAVLLDMDTVELSADSLILAIDLATNQPAKLTLSIRERCRFTTTVDIQVLIDSFAGLDGEPGCVNMAVRLYHDVNMAEVFAHNRKSNGLASYEYPNECMFQPDEKAQQNRFLSEWLGLCLRHGMATTDSKLILNKGMAMPSTSDPAIPVAVAALQASAVPVTPASNLAADL